MPYIRKVRDLKAKKKKFVYQKIMRSQGYHDPNIFDLIKNTFCSMTFIEKPISGGVKFVVSFVHCIVLFITLLSVYSVHLASQANLMNEESIRMALAFDTTKSGSLRDDAIQWMLDQNMSISNLVLNDFERSSFKIRDNYFGRHGESYIYNIKIDKSEIYLSGGEAKFKNLIIEDSNVNFSSNGIELSPLVIEDSDVDFTSNGIKVSQLVIEDSDVNFSSKDIKASSLVLRNSHVTFFGTEQRERSYVYSNCLYNSQVTLEYVSGFTLGNTIGFDVSLRATSSYLSDQLEGECDKRMGWLVIRKSEKVVINGRLAKKIWVFDSDDVSIDFQSNKDDVYMPKVIYFSGVDNSKFTMTEFVTLIVHESTIRVDGNLYYSYGPRNFPYLSVSPDDEYKLSTVHLFGSFAIIEADLNYINLVAPHGNTFVGMLVIKNSSQEQCEKIISTAGMLSVELGNVTFIDYKPCTYGRMVKRNAWNIATKNIGHELFIEGQKIEESQLRAEMEKYFRRKSLY
ncbi:MULTISPECIES: hypothetical protein [unclassified Pseudoalteromonas]|uniref:hypothetical protein n=1 Tax=unclassified Pseudoalteromonas TaxID=194690 RepID=UPI001F26ABE2|nr:MULTISPECIES: hypothetical protein [unclassified Pseudoalteromonas]MCF2827091.1 hypothetical protein [Pseudoalteromonas sp. OF5H-5]MCF2832053.1 hypothetical protein [Pseudoalteromonas sp. DL2-H6]MCF2925896.1 hypothetical protein [Pseudoalteromonas sp. DL2-H1]